MYSLTTVIIVAVVGFIAGGLIGVFGFQRFGRQGLRNQDLAKKLADAEQEMKDYQANVTEHFEETSRRVNTLTKSYKDVHEYLASSAMKLTNPQMSLAISQAAQQNIPDQSAQDPIDQAENETGNLDADELAAKDYGVEPEEHNEEEPEKVS